MWLLFRESSISQYYVYIHNKLLKSSLSTPAVLKCYMVRFHGRTNELTNYVSCQENATQMYSSKCLNLGESGVIFEFYSFFLLSNSSKQTE